MKFFSILLLLVLGLFSFEASAKWFQQKTIYSKALQQDKTYYVGLPEGYNESDTLTKYPVILFLHGASVTAADMVNSLEPFLDNALSKFLFAKLFKVIFVIPDGSSEPFKGSFYTNSSLYGNYEDYIVQDMMEEIRSKYHTYNRREKFGIMGHSMGGYGAMKIALKYPENYIGVSALSGPLNITRYDEILPVLYAEHGSVAPYDFTNSGNVTKLLYSMAGAFSPSPGDNPPIQFPINPDGTTNHLVTELWEIHNPINLIRTWKGNPAMAVYTYCGELDEFKLAKSNQMFADTLNKYNLQHTYKQDPYGDHVNSLFTSLPQGVNFLYDVMDTAKIHLVTSVDHMTFESMTSVYPNPTSDRFFISGTTDNLQQIVVYNIAGQKLMQIENPALNEGFDIRSIAKGVYLVSLSSKKGCTSTYRLIKN